MKVLLLGATGYAGSLLLRLLLNHPHVTNISAFSSSKVGNPISEPTLPNPQKLTKPFYIGSNDLETSYDIVFSALPHGVSISKYRELENSYLKNAVYIDLSADFRFSDVNTYLEVYGEYSEEKKSVALTRTFAKSVYGLCELQRQRIIESNIIACPGCYPTSILLPLIPILKYCSPTASVTCNSISGVSGAGSSPNPDLLFGSRTESLKPYAPGRIHRHYSEIAYQLKEIAFSEANLTFTPCLAPLKQGILSTITIPLNKKDVVRASEVLKAQYIDEPFIRILDSESAPAIDTQLVKNTNSMLIALHQEEDCLIVFSVIDNLWKGAAGQAIQNFNIRFGFDECTGLQFFAT